MKITGLKLDNDARLLQGLIGSTVVRAIFEIWPSIDWPEAADTRLFLESRTVAGDFVAVCFGEDAAAEAMVEPSGMEADYRAAELAQQLLTWKTEAFGQRGRGIGIAFRWKVMLTSVGSLVPQSRGLN